MATPLIPFAVAWLIGIWSASRLALPTIALGVATLVAAVGIILARRAPRPRRMIILALAAILGALRYNLAQPHFDQTTLATFNDQQKTVIVEGLIVAEPDARDTYTNLRVEADKLAITDQPTCTVRGPVLVSALRFSDFRYGDRVRAEGRLRTPTNTGDFDYREYLARQVVYSTPHPAVGAGVMSRPRVTVLTHDQGLAPLAWLFAFKARAKNVIAQTLNVPEPQTSLLAGIPLGDDSGIPEDVQEAFRMTGTPHIIAISG